MQNTSLTVGPLSLTASAANLFNPGTTTGGVNCTAAPWDKLYFLLKQIHVANTSSSAATCTFYRGATAGSAAGTEIAKGKNVPANDYIDLPFYNLRFATTDFLTGLASIASNTLVVTFIGEIGIGA